MENKINIYEYFYNLSMEEFVEIISNAKTEEEKEFYRKSWSFILQEKQREAIKKGVY